MLFSGLDRRADLEKPILKFHTIHGRNIKREQDGRRAVRTSSFCNGVAFSNRPILIDERVCIRQSVVSSEWSGVLRFGVTNVDPASLRSRELPKFACPTLNEKPGYWIRALPDRFASEGNLVQFFVSPNGEIHYNINGADKGIFLTGVRTASQLWVIIDVYGTAKAVEFERSRVLPIDESIRSMHSDFSTRLRVASPAPCPLPLPRPSTAIDRTPSLRGALSLFGISLGGGGGGYRSTDDRRPAPSQSSADGRRIDSIPSPPRIPAPATPVARPRPMRLPPPVTRQLASASSSTVIPTPARTSSLVRVTPSPTSTTSSSSSSSIRSLRPTLTSDFGRRLLAETRPSSTVRASRDDDASIYRRIQQFSETTTRIVREFVEANSPLAITSSPVTARIQTTSPSRTRNPTASSSNARGPMMESERYLRLRHQATSSPMARSPLAAATAQNQTTSSSSSSTRSGQRTPVARALLNQMTSSTRNVTAPNQVTFSSSSTSLSSQMTSSTSVSATQNQMTSSFSATRLNSQRTPASNRMTSSTTACISKKQVTSSSRDSASRDDCSVCMEAPVNSVIYTCGHMCMCYECALKIKVSGQGCPICREPMKDVIKTFKA